MVCNNCGKEIEAGTKFCSSCGTKVEAKKAPKKVEKKEEAKEVKKETVKVEPVNNSNQGSSALGIVSMVLGIVSFILSWFLTVFIIVFPIAGLILGICAKGKKGFKITGIILNALSIVIAIIMFIAGLAAIGRGVKESIPEIKEGVREVQKTVKSGYPYGTWTCVSYYSTEATQYSDDVTKAPSDKKTVLNLYTDNSFRYGPYSESYKNYYKGTFTYTIETDKNEKYKNQGEAFIDVKGTITDAMIDGVAAPDKTNMNLEMGLLETDNYDTAVILFYSSYNTYYCQR
ncbi:MAG: zinc-ribbon domain-containing protein [Bacilli bacterium]|nr:zinc-ribbon domain-containing protein [Bacilli bacterium]